ncbi:hypothetical protein GOV11_01710 [Candidatus Woesearchaeota archaeon]|nr:hypothetical protein [Candidatus Woesearchaeota archaeon]
MRLWHIGLLVFFVLFVVSLLPQDVTALRYCKVNSCPIEDHACYDSKPAECNDAYPDGCLANDGTNPAGWEGRCECPGNNPNACLNEAFDLDIYCTCYCAYTICPDGSCGRGYGDFCSNDNDCCGALACVAGKCGETSPSGCIVNTEIPGNACGICGNEILKCDLFGEWQYDKCDDPCDDGGGDPSVCPTVGDSCNFGTGVTRDNDGECYCDCNGGLTQRSYKTDKNWYVEDPPDMCLRDPADICCSFDQCAYGDGCYVPGQTHARDLNPDRFLCSDVRPDGTGTTCGANDVPQMFKCTNAHVGDEITITSNTGADAIYNDVYCCDKDASGTLFWNQGGCGVPTCDLDTDCEPPGEHCGNCADCACPTSADPATNTECCGSACFDTQTDKDHCGSCDNPCADDEVCQGGFCVSPPTCPDGVPDPGENCFNCPADVGCGGTCCNDGTCVDITSDPNNCGVCYLTCESNEVCSGSDCVCAPGFTNKRYKAGFNYQVWNNEDIQRRQFAGTYDLCCDAGNQCVGGDGACYSVSTFMNSERTSVCEDKTHVYPLYPDLGPTEAYCGPYPSINTLGFKVNEGKRLKFIDLGNEEYCCSMYSSGPRINQYGFGDGGLANKSETNGPRDQSPNDHCWDGSNNDCSIEAPGDYDQTTDYDGYTMGRVISNKAKMGDPNCEVNLDSISAPDTVTGDAACISPISVTCRAGVENVTSVKARIGAVACIADSAFTVVEDPMNQLEGWDGKDRHFLCTVPSGPGPVTAECYVDSEFSASAVGRDSRTKSINILCDADISGTVRDTKTGDIIVDATVNASRGGVVEASVTTDASGEYTLSIMLGEKYNYTAYAEYYYDTDQKNDIVLQDSIANFDFWLSPEECQKECTLFGICNLNECLGTNECALSGKPGPNDDAFDKYSNEVCVGPPFGTYCGDSEGFEKEVIRICEQTDAGKSFDFADGLRIRCCGSKFGDIFLPSEETTPFQLVSCAEDTIPHVRLVEYNGKIYKLVVLSYRKCEV